jgi:uncharacterized protein YkwD
MVRLRGPWLLLVVVTVLLAACPADEDPFDPDVTAPEAVDPPDAAETGEEAIARDLFDRLNDERRERGLDAVAWDEQLAELARDWSREMAEDAQFEHRPIDRELVLDELDGFVGVGENIFMAAGPAPAGFAHVGWMESPSHRANLLSPGWDRVGIGVLCTDGGWYATQNFGRTAGAGGPADPPDEPPPEDPVARPERDGPTC